MVLMKFRLGMAILVVFVTIGMGIVSAETRVIPASIEQGPFTEFRLTADNAFEGAEYGRSVAIDGDLVAIGAGGRWICWGGVPVQAPGHDIHPRSDTGFSGCDFGYFP